MLGRLLPASKCLSERWVGEGRKQERVAPVTKGGKGEEEWGRRRAPKSDGQLMSGVGKGKKKRATDGRREEKEKKLGKFGGGEKLSSLFPRRKKEGWRKKWGRPSCHARSATKGIVTFVVDTKKTYFTLTVSHASGVFSLIPGACRLP